MKEKENKRVKEIDRKERKRDRERQIQGEI